MNLPCDKRVTCPDNALLTNYSAEQPDRQLFLGVSYSNFFPNINIRSVVVITTGCTTFSSSLLTQQDADLCAQRHATECQIGTSLPDPCEVCRPSTPGTDFGFFGVPAETDPTAPCCHPEDPQGCCCDTTPADPDPPVPPVPPDPPQPQLYANTQQSCSRHCPSGGTTTYTVRAGQFVATSLELANRMAYSYACQQVAHNPLCLDCESIEEGKCDQPYDIQLQASGGTEPYTFALAQDTPLPAGLTMLSTGQIVGTPSGLPSVTTLRIRVEDSSLNFMNQPDHLTMEQECVLTITGPKFTNAGPIDGEECAVYGHEISGGFFFTAEPAGCTFSCTGLPEGITCLASGKLDGTPLQRGSFVITVTATDPDGNVNTKQYPLIINAITTDVSLSHFPPYVFQRCKSIGDIGNWTDKNGLIFGTNSGLVSSTIETTQNLASISLIFGPGSGAPAIQGRFGRLVVCNACSLATKYTQRMSLSWTIPVGGRIVFNVYLLGQTVFPFNFQSVNASGSGTITAISDVSPFENDTFMQIDAADMAVGTFATVNITIVKL